MENRGGGSSAPREIGSLGLFTKAKEGRVGGKLRKGGRSRISEKGWEEKGYRGGGLSFSRKFLGGGPRKWNTHRFGGGEGGCGRRNVWMFVPSLKKEKKKETGESRRGGLGVRVGEEERGENSGKREPAGPLAQGKRNHEGGRY